MSIDNQVNLELANGHTDTAELCEALTELEERLIPVLLGDLPPSSVSEDLPELVPLAHHIREIMGSVKSGTYRIRRLLNSLEI